MPAKSAAQAVAESMPPVGEAAPRAWSPGEPILARHWEALRAPFGAGVIERLPKPLKSGDQDKGRCEQGSRYCADQHPCGGWHVRSLHLSYVGHAGVTDRLNDCDPTWNWTPVAFDQQGLPLIANGGLWINLTIYGVTRLGFGDAPGKRDATKELIGDAIRNGAMRFGVGTYLWSKSADAQVLAAGGDPDAERDKAPAQTSRPAQQENAAPRSEPWQDACVEAWSHLNEAQQAYAKELWPQGASGPASIARQHADPALQIMATIMERYPEGRASYEAQQAEQQGAPDPT